MYAFLTCNPSSRCMEVGRFAKPALCSAAYRKSPERSPVNIRPVRFAPCAAGASPRMSNCACESPKPGIGLPQYSHSRYARRFSRATFSRYFTSRGHFRHATISSFSTQSRERVSGIGLVCAEIHHAIQLGVGCSSEEHRLKGPLFQHLLCDALYGAHGGA